MHRTIIAAAAATLWLSTAQADPFTDAVIQKYQEMGFDFIEVQNGVSQVKVEAIKDGRKIEVIYDRATGQILKQEQERAEADEANRAGVQVRDRSRDFVGASMGGGSVALSGNTETVVAELQAQGYEFIEVKNGPTQVKIEAVRGTRKVELIMDRDTGEILKQEVEHAGSDAGRSGLQIDSRDEDFLDDDDRDDSGRGSDDDDDDDNSGHGSGDDDDDDDNSGHGSGDDDDDEEDDDDHDEDNSGPGSHD